MSNHVMALEILIQKTPKSLQFVEESWSGILGYLKDYPEVFILKVNYHICIWVYGEHHNNLLACISKFQSFVKKYDLLLDNDAIQHLNNIVQNKVWADVNITMKYDSILAEMNNYTSRCKSSIELKSIFDSAISCLEQHSTIKGRANSFKNFPGKGRSPDKHHFSPVQFQYLFYRFCIN